MRVAALLLALLLSACGGGAGGGGPSSSGTITPAPPLRTDLLFGYYGGCMPEILEEAPHANLWWATGWCQGTGSWFLDMAQELQAARGAGIKNVVLALAPTMVWGPNAAAEASFQFQRLAATGQLVGWDSITLYPQDEPDVHGYTDAQMTAAITAIRAAAKPYAEFAGAKLAVIYNCRSPMKPGLASFDWIGCDNYGAGCAALDELSAIPLTSGQRLMVVPGGADPWRQDPACFTSFAERTPSVIAIVPFIWFDDYSDITRPGSGPKGIRSNGMRPLYCQAGRTAVAPGEPAGC